MATAAILVALFTTTLTIGLSPHHVTGPHQAAGDGICPTCEPSTIAIPTNLRHEYYFEDRVNGAGDGPIALLVVPLIGAALGALRAATSATHRPPPDLRASQRERDRPVGAGRCLSVDTRPSVDTRERTAGGAHRARPGQSHST